MTFFLSLFSPAKIITFLFNVSIVPSLGARACITLDQTVRRTSMFYDIVILTLVKGLIRDKPRLLNGEVVLLRGDADKEVIQWRDDQYLIRLRPIDDTCEI